MNENESNLPDVNRRDFLKGGSLATLMTLLGGVELIRPRDTSAEIPTNNASDPAAAKAKVAVIGLGFWGREIVSAIAREPVSTIAETATICDTYPAAFSRCAKDAPKAAQTKDYKTILENKDVSAVIVATPTHLHNEIVLAALKAG